MARPGKPTAPVFDWISLAFAILVITLAAATAVAGYLFMRRLVSGWTMTALPGEPSDLLEAAHPAPSLTLESTADTALPSATPTPDVWTGSQRINVLLLGLDYRDWETRSIPRSDTMILLTVDPASKTAGMLSIPRDMWVVIPGFNYGKINTAYFLGETYKLPGGGPALAAETVENFLGVPVDYYAQVDFDAFVKFIDELGGLDMHIRQAIKVDPVGPGNTIILQPGVQTLSGAVALAYARNRYTQQDDFDRARRQQEVILAIRDQVINLNMLPTLIIKATRLYEELSSGIRTNLSLTQVIELANLGSQIPPENIRKGVIGTTMVTFNTSPDGLAVLKPVPDQIRLLRDEIFTSGGPLGPAAHAENRIELVQGEGARAVLEDGTSKPEAALRAQDILTAAGVEVIRVTKTGKSLRETILVDHSGKPYTMGYLADLMQVPTNRIFSQFDPESEMDIEIQLGRDWLKLLPSPSPSPSTSPSPSPTPSPSASASPTALATTSPTTTLPTSH